MEHLIHQVESAFLRKSVYEIVGALTKGHSIIAVIAISVIVIAGVFAFQKWYGKRK